MSRPATRTVPLPPGPHGQVVEYVCRSCLARACAYAGQLPRDWRPEHGSRAVYCPRCWSPAGLREGRVVAPAPTDGG